MRTRLMRLLLVLSFTVLALTIFANATANAADPRLYSVGVASIDITPDYPIRLRGYAGRHSESDGIVQRLRAQALAIGGRAGEAPTALLVTMDNCIVPDAMVRRVAARLKDKCGVSRERFTVTATHTHNGPILSGMSATLYVHPLPEDQAGRIARYTRELEEKLYRVVSAALADRRPAQLSWIVGKAKFAHNRRTRGGPVDHDLPVLLAQSPEGKTRGVYVSYACHCTTLNHNKLSGDWAGYARERIEAAYPGAVALVSAGCGGDQNPQRGAKKPEEQDKLAARHGAEILAEVKRLMAGDMRNIGGNLTTRFRTIDLPIGKLPSRAEWARRAATGQKAGTPGYHGRVQLDRLNRGERLRTHVPYPVQTWRFGDDLAMIFLGGEVVVDYALRLKKELDPKRVWVNAYSNDVSCYIPSERVLAEGGYEGGGAMIYHDWPAAFAPGIEQRIINAVREQIPAAFVRAKAAGGVGASEFPTPIKPLVRAVDLDVGESQKVTLCDGSTASVKLVALNETRDDLRNAVRRAVVTVEVNGQRADFTSATYRLPQAVAGVRIDCPITNGYVRNARPEPWGLDKAARLRLWPADSSWIAPGTFGYPAKQRWFASDTQMANVPTFVDAGEVPGSKRIYYHYGLDIGGPEGLVDIVAATDGIVVSSGTERLSGHENTPVSPRYDVVYLLDGRGWYYRYSHLQTIDPAVKPGAKVRLGQKIGVLGKEGGSGGWSHLHFDISSRQPSGKWGIQEGYAFLWETYLRERQPSVVAVARPHDVVRAGGKVVLDGSRSWAADGKRLSFEWTLHDGQKSRAPTVERRYDAPGEYSEILKVTDSMGRVSYDFAVVQVFDPERPQRLATIHAAYAPTFDVRPGQEVTFKVRSFGCRTGETWDFGDGSAKVKVRSDGNKKKLAKDGYAVTTHRFERPGDYIVTVEHVNPQGVRAMARLWVPVRD